MPATFARPELLASPDWLAENLGRSGMRILDCRWRVDGAGQRLYAAGHVPGAVFLDWASDLVDADDPLPFQLAGPEAFAIAMNRVAVGDGMTVVVYDDTHSLYSSRVWWSLRAYGFESVRVLDGGWPGWVASGRPTSSGVPKPHSPTAFTPRLDPRRRLSTADVARLLNSSRALLIDTRTPAEFMGQGGIGPRRGHIPGAVNLPAALLGREDSQFFPPPEEIASLLAPRGVERNLRLVAYDATGIGAAKLAFTLELLGFEDVAVYDGGWADWAPRSDEYHPIET